MRLLPALLATTLAWVLGACGDDVPAPPDTRQLGAHGPGPAASAFAEPRGLTVPVPPELPPRTAVQLVRASDGGALALWVQDGAVLTSGYSRGSGWSAPAPLEDIYGEASDAQLASNGQGSAMALWRHTVGRIESLRFSRFEAGRGWSRPDVLPGALPRPRPEGALPGLAAPQAPELTMDVEGNAFAQWPSGFDAREMQTARYLAGRGWARARSEPLAAAALPLAPGSLAPSPPRGPVLQDPADQAR